MLAGWLPGAVRGHAGLTLTAPVNYQVSQRATVDRGTVTVRGELEGAASERPEIEYRLIRDGAAGPWAPLMVTLAERRFEAVLEAPAGGWWRLEVRATRAGKTIGEAAVDHVGIGEVFVVAGQSNSANHGEERQRTKTGLVATFDGVGWRLADDPQPGASGDGGSFLPPFGDAVAERFKVPVGVIACGVGATSVREWLPRGARFPEPPTLEGQVQPAAGGGWESKGALYDAFAARMRLPGPRGFRAVLWHQGESDANQPDPRRSLPGPLYREFLGRLIGDSRQAIGWEAPWFVAQASYHVPGDESSAEIREAQAALWRDGLALPGPDTDTLKGEWRDGGGQGVHFSGPGLREHAARWVEKVAPWLEKQLEAAAVTPAAAAAVEPRASERGREAWMAQAPLEPALWPDAGHPVNRDRLYDFYAKQADWFAAQPDVLDLILPEYPGLDSGRYGHWGNQNEDVWKDARWNLTDHGSVVSNVWRGAGMTIPKAVSVQLVRARDGAPGLAAVFNPVTATWDAVWRGGFVTFSDIRHGFMDGATMAGEVVSASRAGKPPVPVAYRGFYRHGESVIFAYAIGGREVLDRADAVDGAFVRRIVPRDAPEAAAWTRGGPAQWPEVVETLEIPGAARPGDAFVVDALTLPTDNPWRALMHVTGHDFFADGLGALCTMGGEVWTVRRTDGSPARLQWRRFATGLHQPLGLKIVDGKIHVLGRDQITRLHDLNADGEADFYECVSNAYETSPGGHDFITGLEVGPDGAFYFVSATQGVCRVAPGGGAVESLATGFRNANGVAVAADGTVLTNGQEGEWTNASVLFQFRPGSGEAPYFGYGGPKPGRTIAKPLLQLPRGFDNSTGGACFIEGAAGPGWEPLRGLVVSTSFGAGTASLIVRDPAAGMAQAAAVAIPGSFRSGAHRARFAPHDGHLYVSGSAGWGTYTPDDGCLHRVRVVAPPLLPVSWEARDNGVQMTFSRPVEAAVAANAKNHFAQVWNYRFAADYGSPEYSVRHPGTPGHDPLEVRSAHVLDDGRTVFLEIPQLTPANQLHLRLRVGGPRPLDVFATVHTLAPAFTAFPGYQPVAKLPVPDAPLSVDAVSALSSRPNPWAEGAAGRAIGMEAALGLQFATKKLSAHPGERLSLTFKNPDLVPHNFVLAKPGSLGALGDQVNKLISRPGAAARHYVPDSPDVLVWTDMVNPGQETTIHFDAPSTPGTYPYFCSFPGHWQVMNGVLEVAAP